jgi:hypothetical protein
MKQQNTHEIVAAVFAPVRHHLELGLAKHIAPAGVEQSVSVSSLSWTTQSLRGAGPSNKDGPHSSRQSPAV